MTLTIAWGGKHHPDTPITKTPETRGTCPHCHREIDEDWCWCGEHREAHEWPCMNHGFVPMGCTCGYGPEPEGSK